MKLIQRISSTLQTWVFKKKLLKFSEKFERDPLACFYCPEMCRFSCSTAETLKTNAVTPRGKMSLLHLSERGFSDERVAGSTEQKLWYLEQCTGCGRCTEFCVYENDVASNLRAERGKVYAKLGMVSSVGMDALLHEIAQWNGVVLIGEPARSKVWSESKELIAELLVTSICFSDSVAKVARLWGQGKLPTEDLRKLAAALQGLKKVKKIWIENPEIAWFFAKGLINEAGLTGIEVRTLWQALYPRMLNATFEVDAVLNESFYLARLLPRLGYSIPMYEKGFMPFHSGWNTHDSGAESFYSDVNPNAAREMGQRYLRDLEKDGRKVSRIICQSLDAVSHFKELGVQASYWVDEVLG